MASIKIATGIKTYDIEDQEGNVRGQMKFNPSDVNFIKRLSEMEAKIDDYLEAYANRSAELGDDESNMETILNELVDYDRAIKTIINETFEDENLSNVVFGTESCFNIYNGKTFVERFVEGIVPVIKEDVEKATASIDDKISKYTAQKFEQ